MWGGGARSIQGRPGGCVNSRAAEVWQLLRTLGLEWQAAKDCPRRADSYAENLQRAAGLSVKICTPRAVKSARQLAGASCCLWVLAAAGHQAGCAMRQALHGDALEVQYPTVGALRHVPHCCQGVTVVAALPLLPSLALYPDAGTRK